MVPSRYETMDTLPKLPSGKVNRNLLKKAELTAAAPVEEQEGAAHRDGSRAGGSRAALPPPQTIPFDADFSPTSAVISLLPPRAFSAVRDPGFAGMNLQDVYAQRTLCARDRSPRRQVRSADRRRTAFTPPPLMRRFWCGAAQAIAIALPIILSLMTAQWLGVFVSYDAADPDPRRKHLDRMVACSASTSASTSPTIILSIVMKWVLLGRARSPAAIIPVGRWYYLSLVAGAAPDGQTTHMKWFQASPIMRLYLSALGAKIGDDAIISEMEVAAIDLVGRSARARASAQDEALQCASSATN